MTTRQEAINLMCKECIYDEQEKGTWIQQISNCTIKDCPLYPFRKKTKKLKDEEREEVLSSMSEEERKRYYERINKTKARLTEARLTKGWWKGV